MFEGKKCLMNQVRWAHLVYGSLGILITGPPDHTSPISFLRLFPTSNSRLLPKRQLPIIGSHFCP